MKTGSWRTSYFSVASLHLDSKNPRLGRETSSRAPCEIIQYLFEHDKAMELAGSIALRGYFPNEPLLAVKEDTRLVVVEGNRRLAALKALREPGLLGGALERRVARLSRRIKNSDEIARVPVTIASNRRDTDLQMAGRHIATPVLAWRAENRASFILDKLAEGYSNDELRDNLGFSLADIQKARQTRAIAEMARSLDLPEKAKTILSNPKGKHFSTLERVFESTVGRDYMLVVPDPDHGLRGITTKKQFLRGFKKLVIDVVLGPQSTRTFNKNEDIRRYFEKWDSCELPMKKRGSFVPADIIREGAGASPQPAASTPRPKSSKKESTKVIPRDFKVRHGGDRLIDISRELKSLTRAGYPNAGAVLLRVFFELAVNDYLGRIGELPGIIQRIEEKGGRPLPFGTPTLKQLVPEIKRIAKLHLNYKEALGVTKAIHYDRSAPFSIPELHGFVHSSDLPSERDIHQFWLRTEPLFRLMLETDSEGVTG